MTASNSAHGTTYPDAADWRERAACLRVDPETMFPDRTDVVGNEIAKRICQRCPVTRECLELAAKFDLRHGVFGGQTEVERDNGHGTMDMYRQGCKCRRCRSAKATYSRLRRLQEAS